MESTSLELEFKTLNFRLNNVEKQYKELKQELSDYVEPIKQNSNHSKIDNILAKIPKYRPLTRMGTRGEEFFDNWICKLWLTRRNIWDAFGSDKIVQNKCANLSFDENRTLLAIKFADNG